MSRRNFLKGSLAPLVLASLPQFACSTDPAKGPVLTSPGAGENSREAVLDAMRRAVRHMDENISYRGGYVWAYLPDLTRTWGEMEAKRSMCWIQPPGTPSVAHAFIDAYHATGDELFYRAAERSALALVAAQHPSGGWNYIHDFAGEDSLRHWYETIGRNGWRLEEFQHYYGNATFDDAGTAVSAQVLLRMYLAKRDERFRAPLYQAIDFIEKAQYQGGVADGGWPQRWPPVPGIAAMPVPPGLPAGATSGMEDGDYTGHVTFNDDVMGENIKFLLMCVTALGEARLVAPVRRAMDCMLRLQQPAPQAGWGLQHLARDQGGRKAGAPAAARSYEPRSLATHTTQTNIRQLFNYFRLTGERKYLARIPEALAWLKSCTLTPQMLAENPLLAKRTHPTFVELGTNRPRFVHRYGSNAFNGAYYVDHDHRDTPSHYSAGRGINIAALEKEYAYLAALSAAEIQALQAASPLNAAAVRPLPRFFSMQEVDFADLFTGAKPAWPRADAAQVEATLKALGPEDCWLDALPAITNPYRGDGPRSPHAGREYMSRNVGDITDTSPYDPRKPPEIAPYTSQQAPLGITTKSFVKRLGVLTAWLAQGGEG